MDQNEETSMKTSSLQKSRKMKNQTGWPPKLRNINIKRRHWIRCRTRSCKKMKKKKILAKIEDFKMHHWQYFIDRIHNKDLCEIQDVKT